MPRPNHRTPGLALLVAGLASACRRDTAALSAREVRDLDRGLTNLTGPSIEPGVLAALTTTLASESPPAVDVGYSAECRTLLHTAVFELAHEGHTERLGEVHRACRFACPVDFGPMMALPPAERVGYLDRACGPSQGAVPPELRAGPEPTWQMYVFTRNVFGAIDARLQRDSSEPVRRLQTRFRRLVREIYTRMRQPPPPPE